MPQGLVDLGNGVQMLNPSDLTKNMAGASEVGNALSLVNLQNQIQNAPLERAKMAAEAKLKENEVTQIQVSNELQRQQLWNAINNEQREQAKFTLEAYRQLPEMFQLGLPYGQGFLRQLNPNAQATQNEDGTFSVEFPTQKKEIGPDGQERIVSAKESISFSAFPNRLTEEQKLTLTNQSAVRFNSDPTIKDFAEISQSYQNFKESSDLATGQGDLNMIYSYIKMVNPNSTLRPGQQASFENMGSLFNTLGNLWDKATKDEAPVFGKDPNSKERKNFKAAGEILYKNSRASALAVGRHVADYAKSQGLNPDAILFPVGDISVRQFKMTDKELVDWATKKYGTQPVTQETP